MKAVARKTLVVLTILGNLFLIGIGIYIMEEYQYEEEIGIFCIIIAVLNLIATPYKIVSGRFNYKRRSKIVPPGGATMYHRVFI